MGDEDAFVKEGANDIIVVVMVVVLSMVLLTGKLALEVIKDGAAEGCTTAEPRSVDDVDGDKDDCEANVEFKLLLLLIAVSLIEDDTGGVLLLLFTNSVAFGCSNSTLIESL